MNFVDEDGPITGCQRWLRNDRRDMSTRWGIGDNRAHGITQGSLSGYMHYARTIWG